MCLLTLSVPRMRVPVSAAIAGPNARRPGLCKGKGCDLPRLCQGRGERLRGHPPLQVPQGQAGRGPGHLRHQVELHQVRPYANREVRALNGVLWYLLPFFVATAIRGGPNAVWWEPRVVAVLSWVHLVKSRGTNLCRSLRTQIWVFGMAVHRDARAGNGIAVVVCKRCFPGRESAWTKRIKSNLVFVVASTDIIMCCGR